MKKKIITSMFIFIILTFSIVQAAGKLNFQITLPEDLKNNMINEQTKQYYEQNNIYLHAVNDKQDEAVMVMQVENEANKRISNLKELNEQNFNAVLEYYNNQKSQEGINVLKQETYQKEELLFIDTIYEKATDEQRIQTEEYYTVFDGKTIMISISFLNKDVDTLKVRQIIDSIELIKEESKNIIEDSMYLWIIPVALIVLLILYMIKEKRSNIKLEENEKNKILQNVIEHMNKITDYSKFKGILILFAITIGLNIINLLFGMIDIVKQSNLLVEASIFTKIYNTLLVIQNLVQLVGVIYIAYCLRKKEAKTIKKIENTFIAIFISVILVTIIRIIMSMGVGQSLVKYIIYEMQIFIRSVIYVVIWYCYFKNSIRVSVYYKEKSIEQIIKEPKKGYQTNRVNKKMTEFKIIDYFKSQKAYDYATGIYINKLPKEYAKSLSLLDLNSKRIIRLKKAKYYLSMKDLENPKAENRKIVKTICWIALIYIFIMLILYIF